MAEPDVTLPVKEALYRVSQEALNNIVKHAGATEVGVMLQEENGHLTFTITDNGLGFDTAAQFPGHLGLKSMRERVERIGGRFQLESEPGQGTTLVIVVSPQPPP